MGTVDAWKDIHADLDKKAIDKDNRLKVMKRDLAEIQREKQTLVKRGERDDLSNRLEVEKMRQERQELAAQLARSNEDVSILAQQSSQVCSCNLLRLASSLICPYSHCCDKV